MPVFIGRIDDKLEAYLTCWVLPVRKEEIHWSIQGGMTSAAAQKARDAVHALGVA